MMVVMMPVVNDDDLLRAGAVPAGLAFARLYLRANSAPLPRISPLVWPPAASRLASPPRGDVCSVFAFGPAFEISSASDGDTKATTVKVAIT